MGKQIRDTNIHSQLFTDNRKIIVMEEKKVQYLIVADIGHNIQIHLEKMK